MFSVSFVLKINSTPTNQQKHNKIRGKNRQGQQCLLDVTTEEKFLNPTNDLNQENLGGKFFKVVFVGLFMPFSLLRIALCPASSANNNVNFQNLRAITLRCCVTYYHLHSEGGCIVKK